MGNSPKSDFIYHLLIDFEPNVISFGSKSIGKWYNQISVSLTRIRSIFLCVYIFIIAQLLYFIFIIIIEIINNNYYDCNYYNVNDINCCVLSYQWYYLLCIYNITTIIFMCTKKIYQFCFFVAPTYVYFMYLFYVNYVYIAWERDWKNKWGQTLIGPRDWRLSASWGPNWRLPWNPSDHHSIIVLWGFREAHDWVPIMPRDSSVSDSKV